MPLAALLTVLGANAIGMMPIQLERPDFPEPSSPVVVAESSVTARPAASRRDRPGYPTVLRYEAAPSPEMVVSVGDRRTEPQLELGAFGGGRTRAGGLVHVGIGFDF